MDPNTQAMLGNLVNAGCDALDVGDNDRAVELLTMPAEMGIDIAMFNIAIAHKRRGDLDTAIRWYEAAAEAGDLDAVAYLGWMFKLLGDLDKASDWYRKAAARGHAHAATALENLRRDNSNVAAMLVRTSSALMAKGHAQNGFVDMAVESWMVAAEAGDPESMYFLGMTADGRGDRGEAILWHTAAARAGNDQAREWLASNMGRGLGNPPTPAGQGASVANAPPPAVCNNGHPMDPKSARCTECGARLQMQWMKDDR